VSLIRNIAVASVIGLSPLMLAQAADLPDWIAPPTYDCKACHAIDHKVVGPAWHDVAMKYKGDPKAKDMLKTKVKNGGAGNWNAVTGGAPMTPHPGLTDEQLDKVVEYVLSLAK
jgi:cytochrome c